MSDAVVAIAAIVLIFAVFPLLIVTLRDRWMTARRRGRQRLEQLSAERAVYEERILRPDWALAERHLQRPIPPALRELYADRHLITRQDLPYLNDEVISTFEPLDGSALLDANPMLECDALVIATNGVGDPVYLRAGPSEPDELHVTHHDGGDTEIFAGSVAQMRDVLRETTRDR